MPLAERLQLPPLHPREIHPCTALPPNRRRSPRPSHLAGGRLGFGLPISSVRNLEEDGSTTTRFSLGWRYPFGRLGSGSPGARASGDSHAEGWARGVARGGDDVAVGANGSLQRKEVEVFEFCHFGTSRPVWGPGERARGRVLEGVGVVPLVCGALNRIGKVGPTSHQLNLVTREFTSSFPFPVPFSW